LNESVNFEERKETKRNKKKQKENKGEKETKRRKKENRTENKSQLYRIIAELFAGCNIPANIFIISQS
jgi:hypothetical protein